MLIPPIVLIPGWWLGAWAYDEVVRLLRAEGYDATAITLPGLESKDTDRSAITFEDHVDAICAAVAAAGRPVILAVHSGTGFTGYAASDRCAASIKAMVYVDTGPGVGAAEPDIEGDKPMDWASVEENENLDGLTEAQKATFRERAVPEPRGVLREGMELTNDARRDIPSTIICTSYTADEYRDAIKAGYDFVAGAPELTHLTFVELPTSHWPMWSRPADLARIIGDIATANAG